MGYTATMAGYASAFNGVFAFLFAALVARLMGRIDSRILIFCGLFLAALVTLWRTTFASNMTFWDVAIPTLIQGAGVPFFFIPLTGMLLSSVKPSETASAAGLSSFVRNVAGAFAASLTTTFWDDGASQAKSQMVNGMHDQTATLNQLVQQGLSLEQARAQIDRIATGQSLMLSTDHMFFVISIVLFIASAVVWLMPRQKHPVSVSAAH